MEVLNALPFASSSPSSNSLSPLLRGGSGRARSASTAERIIRGLLTCVFAIVGVVLGAVTGGLIGVATESGVFRGTGIGAISGAVVSMDVVDSSLALWRSNESGIWIALYVLDVICSLLSGRLVREKVDPAVQSAVRSQMNAVDSPFIEALDIFETEGTRGMPRASIDKLPEIKITNGGNVDATGERIGCSVCLQDFQVGESVRRLPTCHHMFHLICIDGWLIRHGSCPLCRRDI
ncbi:NEP1-interacting protein 1 [Ananas comosus]|uniref:NEP1-interacting protein 1 n=2 Tax=Ananas comosus TaxID=4615 RepID=A0A6P5GUQ4_ANACO|nr:NEP1-interacting protein 1 [Ananas comosus]CAD1830549.1 unnamed protein product [Ananas comosus var. bracteatus]CAD1830560.1 unnamed protein product [Ananas comosus var. bracteatus]